MKIAENIHRFKGTLPGHVTLVAVSKTKSVEEIMEAYHTGHKIFGENKIQEMVSKWEAMPKDIEWHMIGHVQTNKVKYMAEFVSLIHAVDSLKLLKEINKQAAKHNRVIDCLLQIKIAEEDSKYGLSEEAAESLLQMDELRELEHVKIVGLMGMATFTDNEMQISEEFNTLKNFYDKHKAAYQLHTLSMGMSGDYSLAMAHGSNMIRVGSALFGARNYS
ncbi:MAG: YggS family pyridoxal phosphate-dependent enzyme [Flavobacteriaceae bacterium]|nr:YggS family pyridoxal phosphate-dependent enzyme [Flavobacteriaceae bacterium]